MVNPRLAKIRKASATIVQSEPPRQQGRDECQAGHVSGAATGSLGVSNVTNNHPTDATALSIGDIQPDRGPSPAEDDWSGAHWERQSDEIDGPYRVVAAEVSAAK